MSDYPMTYSSDVLLMAAVVAVIIVCRLAFRKR
jgi:hypothetical protein